MTNTLRHIQISLVISIALFFTIVAINNIIDFKSNWFFVQHVLSMDTTFQEPSIMNRSITNSLLQRYAYFLIISWQIITAITCWVGIMILISKRKTVAEEFNHSKKVAFIGLFLGFILYMVGFIIIGGEWFSMWQSSIWNGQMKAGLFVNLIMFIMLFLKE